MAQADGVHNNPDKNRFELEVDGETAFTVYQQQGDTLIFVHTEVPLDERGQGVGDALIKGTLQQVREAGQKVIPLCPFVNAYIRRHPEEQDLLTDQTGAARGPSQP